MKCEKQMCKMQFFNKNKINLFITIITQIIIAALYVSLAFLIMTAIEVMEFSDLSKFKVEAIFSVVLVTVYGIIGLINRTFRNRFIKRGLSQFKAYIFKKILGKSIGEFSNASSGKIISTFYNDLGSIEINYLNGTIQLVYMLVMLMMAIAAMFYLNVLLATFTVLACFIPVVFSLIFGKRLIKKELKTSDESESFVDQVKDLINGFTIIKSFKAEKEVNALFEKQNFTLEEAKQERRDTNDTLKIASEISTIIMISVIFVVGQYLAAYKNIISIGVVIAFVQLSNYVMEPLQQIMPLWNNRKAAVELIHKIALVIEDNHETKKITDKSINIEDFSKKIIMKNVSFSYNEDREILHNISLEIEKGKAYAFFGSSGCGKSTLLQLLLGYYHDYTGDVFIDDYNLRDINIDSLYDIMSAIQQNVFLFNSSIKNNITMFKEFTDDKLNRAIEMAGLTKLIEEKGMDYLCGEGGRNLSGGEKQRISIARCLIKETPIIVMDESTAALDNTKAYEIENEIINIKGLTKIIVTHKMDEAILRKYDEIILLHEGQIVEKGTFDSLMESKKFFYSLFYSKKIAANLKVTPKSS